MSCKKYSLIIFDLDGTLVDTTEGILASVDYTIDNFRLPQLSYDDKLTFIGPPVQLSFEKFYSSYGAKIEDLTDTFRNNYSTSNLLKAVPYRGIFDLLDGLLNSKLKLAVATYKREDYALELLNHFKFDSYMQIMYGGDNDNKLKKKDIIVKCIESAEITSYDEVLMIGDTMHDALGAKELGIDFVAITYGFGFKNSDNVADIPNCIGIAKSPMDIYKIVKCHEN